MVKLDVTSLSLRVCRHASGVLNIETRDNVIAYIPSRDQEIARLLAAAPQLLAACRSLLPVAEEGFRNCESDTKEGVSGAAADLVEYGDALLAARLAIKLATDKNENE